jgi:hypothetical protein
MMKKATIRVPGLKVAVPLPADTIPRDLVPTEGPAGEPVIELVLAGSNLTAIARCINPARKILTLGSVLALQHTRCTCARSSWQFARGVSPASA